MSLIKTWITEYLATQPETILAMKHLILLLLVSFSITCSAQVQFGVKAGTGLSEIGLRNSNGDRLPLTFYPKSGFQGGVYARFQVGGQLSISPELLYASKGTRTSAIIIQQAGSSEAVESRFVISLQYLTLPVMVNYQMGERWRIEAGPELGYLLSSRLAIRPSDSRDSEDLNCEKMDFSMNLGAGIALAPKLELGLRYSHGMVNLDPIDEQYTREPLQRRNRAGFLTLSYQVW